MRLFKSSLFIFLISFNSYSFTGTECVQKSFDVSVSHKGWPFGLFVTKLDISKNNCEIEIGHRKLKYLSKSWLIDICREPVHIKENSTSVEVIKKLSSCKGKTSGEFCSTYNEMMTIVQDDGLIFAEGEKENMNSNHGKTYCAYQLLKSYLDRNVVFNRNEQYSDLAQLNESKIKKSTSEKEMAIPEQAPRPQIMGEEAPKPDTNSADVGSGSF